MSKLTTLQVRAIMHAHGVDSYEMYTNKSKNHTGRDRRVKCYFTGNLAMVSELRAAAGGGNVRVTKGAAYARGNMRRGLTVKCQLA